MCKLSGLDGKEKESFFLFDELEFLIFFFLIFFWFFFLEFVMGRIRKFYSFVLISDLSLGKIVSVFKN
ncbi:hypothetical protein LEP1GSC188_3604 [Leptospira weilii serovar Topaz str. LT2116]|uniref:Uncharacterized protein n=1 Tax=Leptospira weilii serovar Topaz str. LT2116 TaxID=1088540 RepID=M3EIG0_9LEPT|nr:hypothetical protein LEP1GSC188_3604 [Leptospira weilii serovar Topaz str. LT2116]